MGEPDIGAEQERDAAKRRSTRDRVRRSNQLSASGSSASVSVLCECGDPCRTWLVVESEVYARASGRRRYVVAHGHHVPDLRRVVLERRDYDVIEAAA